ncbi:VOC family protein [Haladaptatus cibarius]|uniref:VOC family protein n=1 Tax=Haladaptatus cibarius TaxID=453847 RepID=UPI0006796F88|nr:VOC family protein [Haladaptatus cibarius]
MTLLDGVYETHIEVTDLDRAMKFYGDTLGLELGRHEEERGITFYFTGTPRSMLGVWEEDDPEPGHFAFRVAENRVDEMLPFLEKRDIEPRAAFGVEPDEPIVHPWMPSATAYFSDPDGNSLELLADLSDDPDSDGKPMPLSEWHERQN